MKGGGAQHSTAQQNTPHQAQLCTQPQPQAAAAKLPTNRAPDLTSCTRGVPSIAELAQFPLATPLPLLIACQPGPRLH